MSIKLFLSLSKHNKKTKFSKDDADILYSYANYIITLYQNKTENENQEIFKLNLAKNSFTLNADSLEKLSNIVTKIRKNRELELYYAAAFLASHPFKKGKKLTRDIEKCCIFQSRLLIIYHHLSNLKGYQILIKRVMIDYRMLLKEESFNWINLLPNFESDIDDIIAFLASIKEKIIHNRLDKKNENNIFLVKNIARIRNLLRLFNEYKKNNPEYIKRKVRRQKSSYSSSIISTVAPKFINEKEHFYVEEITQPFIENKKYPYNFDERIAEQETIARYFSVDLIAPNDVSRSLTRQNILANATINHILRREKYLTSDVNQLTTYEVFLLMNDCLSNPKLSLESTIILLSLFTGRSLKQILSSEFVYAKIAKPPFNYRVVIVSKPQLPKHKTSKKVLKLISSSDGSVILSLPRLLDESLAIYNLKLCNIDEVKKQISTKITELNRKYGSKITQARIANFFATFLQQNGSDDIETALLLGWDTKHLAGSYYYQVSVKRLLLLHQKYLITLYNMASQKYDDIIKFEQPEDVKSDRSSINFKQKTNESPKNKQENVCVGSNLQLKSDIVSHLFSLLAENLSKLKDDKFEFHNQYTLYTLLLLNLSLGHRPVNDPYESAEIFDCYGGTVFICDKESRSNLSARILAMPDTALAQIKSYFSHLKSMSLYCANILPENKQRIEGALSSTEPLFFFFKSTEITSVTPTNLAHKLKRILPLPINWHRHYMRTKLRKLGISGQLVDLWMGHSGIGCTNMSKFSGLSMHDLRQVANKIEQHLKDDLKIMAVQGL